MKRSSVVGMAAVISLALAVGIARAQTPGLPFTEDFSTQNLMDPAKTTATWSTSEQKVYLAWRRALYGAFGAGTAGSNITGDTDNSCAIALGDLDGDGDLDVVVGNDGVNYVYLNDGTANPFGTAVGTAVTADADVTVTIALGDLDGDGDLDLVAGNNGTPNLLYSGNGDGTFAAGTDITSDADNTEDIAVGDVDGDGLLDVVAGNTSGQANRLYLGNGDGTFAAGTDITGDTDNTGGIAVGDMDGDGLLDVVAGNGNQANRVYLNDGSGDPFDTVTGTAITGDTYDTRAIVLGDVDGDGDLDFIAGENGINHLYLNDGAGDPFDTAAGTDITADNYPTRAVAVGDVDNDGDLDFVVGNVGQETRLYLNNGTAAPFAGTTGNDVSPDTDGTEDIALGDVDGDGDLDIVVANYPQANRLYLNAGTADPFNGVSGSDIDPVDLDDTLDVAIGDMDNDGDLDVVAGNNNDRNRLYLNNGDGTFAAGTDISTDTNSTHSIAVGDMNNDGNLDVVAGNMVGTEPNRLYLGNGDGTFAAGTDITADTGNTISVTLGDVDNDGNLDVVVGNIGQANRLYLNDGTGDPFDTVVGTDISGDTGSTAAVALGDVDNDGDLDVVAGNMNQPDRLYLNDSTGDPFDTVPGTDIDSADSYNTWAIALGDVDGDGDLDVATGSVGQTNRLYLNSGGGTFAAGTDVSTDTNDTRDLAFEDVDNDGDLDIVTGNDGQANRLYLNNGDGTFAAGTDIDAADTDDTWSIVPGDVDNDGWPDVLTGNNGSQANRVYLSGGTTILFNTNVVAGTDATTYAGNTRAVAVGDVDSDGDLDIVEGNSNQAARVYLNNGTADPFAGVTGSDIDPADTQDTFAMALGDVDNDGNLDVIVANSNVENRLYLGNGDGTFAAGADVSVDTNNTRSIALGDVDNDGNLDVVAGNVGINRLYLGNGDGTFAVGTDIITADSHATLGIALGDVDNDGWLDIVAGNTGQVNRLYLNSGTGAFPSGADITGDTYGTEEIALGDMNGDGDLDIVVGNYNEVNRLYLNAGGGTFPAGTDITTDADNTGGMALADVDGDGWLDIVAGNGGEANRVYLNSGTGVPPIFPAGADITADADSTGSVALGDVDGDGTADILAGNYGQANRLYRVKPYSTSQGTAVSLEVDTETADITDALLTCTTAEPVNTGIDWYLSNDGGTVWNLVTPGVRFTFPTTGADLRWKAELRSLSPLLTPEITQVGVDGPGAAISIDDVTLDEGDSGTTDFIFTITLSLDPGVNVSVDWAASSGTATVLSDYIPASSTATFTTGGPLTQTVTVQVVGDMVIEPNETFYVDLTNPVNATISDNQGLGTILDDDGITITINDVSANEGDAATTDFDFTVTISADPLPGNDVTVDWATSDGTASAGLDYVAVAATTLTFTNGGPLSQTVTVQVMGDVNIEPDETFYVDLTNPGNATISDNQGLGTILDDDGTTITITDVSANEGDAGTTNFDFTVTVSTDPLPGSDVTVDWATANGTATTADADYVAGSGMLTFTNGGLLSQTVTIVVNGDTKPEPDETFYVDLTNPVNATISDNQGLGTILSDDAPGAFNLLTPANTATGVPLLPTLDWQDAAGVSTYTLLVDDDPGFGSPAVNDATLTESTYTLTTALTLDTRYYWRVIAVNTNGNTPAANNDFWFRTETSSATPTVVATSPKNRADDASPSTSVVVTFSVAMNRSLTEAAFSLTGPGGPVAGTFSWDAASVRMTFIPNAKLEEDTKYTATVGVGATSQSAVPLAASYTFRFTIRENVGGIYGSGCHCSATAGGGRPFNPADACGAVLPGLVLVLLALRRHRRLLGTR